MEVFRALHSVLEDNPSVGRACICYAGLLERTLGKVVLVHVAGLETLCQVSVRMNPGHYMFAFGDTQNAGTKYTSMLTGQGRSVTNVTECYMTSIHCHAFKWSVQRSGTNSTRCWLFGSLFSHHLQPQLYVIFCLRNRWLYSLPHCCQQSSNHMRTSLFFLLWLDATIKIQVNNNYIDVAQVISLCTWEKVLHSLTLP